MLGQYNICGTVVNRVKSQRYIICEQINRAVLLLGEKKQQLYQGSMLCGIFMSTPNSHIIVYSGYSGHFCWYKIHVFYYIQVGYSGQSDIVARK